MPKLLSLLLVGLLAMAASLSAKSPVNKSADTSKPSGGQNPAETKKSPPLDLKNMDVSVKPQDDFYLYANGTWIKNNPVPPEYPRWAAFTQLAVRNNDALHDIAEKAAAGASKDPKKKMEKASAADLQKVGDFYSSGMNEKAVDAAGAKPLEAEFKRIDSMKGTDDVLKEIGHLHSIGVYPFFLFT